MEPLPAAVGGAGAPQGANVRNVCPECSFVAKNKGGLSLHRRVKHANAYHAEAAAVNEARDRTYWSAEEDNLLARAEAQLSYDGSLSRARVNDQLMGLAVVDRTKDAIKGRRRNPAYKARVES